MQYKVELETNPTRTIGDLKKAVSLLQHGAKYQTLSPVLFTQFVFYCQDRPDQYPDNALALHFTHAKHGGIKYFAKFIKQGDSSEHYPEHLPALDTWQCPPPVVIHDTEDVIQQGRKRRRED